MSIKRKSRSEQQIYGRNDMVNIEPNKKIYGSLGKTEKWFLNTVEGNPITMANSRKGSFEKEVTEFNLYGWSKQETTTGKNLCSIKSCQLSANMASSDIVPWTKKDSIYFSCDTENVDGSKIYVLCRYYNESKIRVGANGGILLADGIRKEISFRGVGASSNGGNVDLTTIEYVNIEIGLPSASTAASSIDNIMVCDEENQPYEPYTGGKPSPSPEYPQEIVSAGNHGSIGIEITGKNLFGGKAFVDKIVELGGTLVGDNVKIDAPKISGKLIYKFTDSSKKYTIIVEGVNSSKIQAVNLSVHYSDGTTGGFGDFVNGKKIAVTIKKDVIGVYGSWYTGEVTYTKFGIFEGEVKESDYEPYKESKAIIPIQGGLLGIPVTTSGNYTDENGQQYICDEIDFAKGKYVQRVWKGVFDGSEAWAQSSSVITDGFYLIDIFPENMYHRKGLCNQAFLNDSKYEIELGVNDKGLYYSYNPFYDASLSDKGLANWKAHLASNPLVVMTYLDTPIETELTQEQLQAYKSLTTFKPTSIISNDEECHMKLTYKATGN